MARKRQQKAAGGYDFVLHTGAVAVQGEAAGIDTATGTVKPMGSAATQIFIGFFGPLPLGPVTGDGTLKVHVEFPEPLLYLEWLANDDAPNDVAAADLGSEVYFKDGTTVSTLGTGRAVAGRVMGYDATGDRVLVQGGLAVTGPSGAAGISGSVADRAELSAVGAASRADGQVVFVQEDRSTFVFEAASTADEDESQQLVIEPAVGDGRWVRSDAAAVLKLAIGFGTADGAALLTVPEGFVLRLTALPFWEVTTAFTGGTSSAIGVASDKTGYTTAGDLLGGASGDVLASLTAGIRPGTIGPKLDSFAELQALFFEEADVVTFERITSAFTAGAGFVCLPVAIMRAAA